MAPVLTVLVLTIAAGLYFLAYVPSRNANMVAQKFRVLGDISFQIEESVVNLHRSFTNSVGASTISPAAITSRLELIRPPIRYDSTSLGTFLIASKFTAPPSLRVQAAGINSFLSLKYSQTQPASAFTASPAQQPQAAGTNSSPSLKPSQTEPAIAFELNVELVELLRPIVSLGEFQDVLLIRDTGDVLFQWSQSTPRAANSLNASDLIISRLPKPAEKSEKPELGQATSSWEIQLAGDRFKVFATPLLSTFGKAEASSGWLICGMVRTREFTVETWTMPTHWMIAYGFASVGVFLIWPFLNVAAGGLRGSVSKFQVAWLLAAALATCVAFNLLILYCHTYLSGRSDQSDQLKSLATNLTANLSKELAKLDDCMDQLDQSLLRQVATNSAGPIWERSEMYATETALSNYPVLIDISWVASNGVQIAKWTPSARVPALTDVFSRDYFQSLMRGWAWKQGLAFTTHQFASSNRSSASKDFYLDSVFSMTRSENVAIYSRRFPDAINWPTNRHLCPVESPAISFVSFKPLSLFEPLLPTGMGYAILEPSGKALFHSRSTRNLRENFLKEIRGDFRLQAVIHSRTPATLSTWYFNNRHRIHAAPIRGTSWTLVTFQDTRGFANAHRNILLVTILFVAAFYAALIALVSTFIGIWNHGIRRFISKSQTPFRPHDWFWPQITGKTPQKESCKKNLPRCLEIAWTFWSQRPMRLRYLVVLGATLLMLALFPTYLIYRSAYLTESDAYGKGILLHLVQDLQRQDTWRSPDASRTRVTRQTLSPETINYWRSVRAWRASHLWNHYSAIFYGATVTPTGSIPWPKSSAESAGWFERLYAQSRPLLNEIDLNSAGLFTTNAMDFSWSSQRFHHGELLLTVRDHAGTNQAVEARSGTPGSSWNSLYSIPSPHPDWKWLRGLGLIASTVAPFFIARFFAQKIVLLDLPTRLRFQPPQEAVIEVFDQITTAIPLIENTSQAFASVEATRLHPMSHSQVKQWMTEDEPPIPEESLVLLLPDVSLDHARTFQTARELRGHHGTVALVRSMEQNFASTHADYELRIRVASEITLRWQAFWSQCSPMEKLTMYQIAQDGFVNPDRPELRVLIDRGWVRFHPELQLRNTSLKRFVLATYRSKEVETQLDETEVSGSWLNWRSIRGSIGVAIVIIAIFVFLTQGEIWQLAIAGATAVAKLSEDLSKFRGLFSGIKSSSSE